jgi:hypothetical protein
MSISAFQACSWYVDEYIFRLLIAKRTDRSRNNGELSNVVHRDGAPPWFFVKTKVSYSSILSHHVLRVHIVYVIFFCPRCHRLAHIDVITSLFHRKFDRCQCLACKSLFWSCWQSNLLTIRLTSAPFWLCLGRKCNRSFAINRSESCILICQIAKHGSHDACLSDNSQYTKYGGTSTEWRVGRIALWISRDVFCRTEWWGLWFWYHNDHENRWFVRNDEPSSLLIRLVR